MRFEKQLFIKPILSNNREKNGMISSSKRRNFRLVSGLFYMTQDIRIFKANLELDGSDPMKLTMFFLMALFNFIQLMKKEFLGLKMVIEPKFIIGQSLENLLLNNFLLL